MNTETVAGLALACLLAVGTVTGTALAAGHDEDREAGALQSAKVSLTQAIATAEQRTGGQAFDAGVDLKGGQVRIAVGTNGPEGVRTVTVDARSGEVVATHAGGERD